MVLQLFLPYRTMLVSLRGARVSSCVRHDHVVHTPYLLVDTQLWFACHVDSEHLKREWRLIKRLNIVQHCTSADNEGCPTTTSSCGQSVSRLLSVHMGSPMVCIASEGRCKLQQLSASSSNDDVVCLCICCASIQGSRFQDLHHC